MLVDEEENDGDGEREFQTMELPEEEEIPATINSIVGLTNPKTLKLIG